MENTQKPRILITNDDGVNSENIHALARALSPFGEVFVFAPETEQSGVGHAFTLRHSLRVKQVDCPKDYKVYSVSGTPADAAKFALGHFAPGGFDVCFSGVNIGENSGVASLYSGTVAGAREAALWGVPAVSLSLSLGGESLMPTVLDFSARVVRERMYESFGPSVFWNVNFPKGTPETFKGFKATKMALGMFTDHYKPTNGEWQLDGEKLWNENPADSDDFLLNAGYATITPHRVDQTDFESLEVIDKMLLAAY